MKKSITINLIIANVIIYILTCYLFPTTFNLFAVYPLSDPNFEIWQPITSMFLHANFTHILINMFVLYSFGTQLEKMIGQNKFSTLYIVSGIISGASWLLFGTSAAVGASGALCSLMSAYMLIVPDSKVLLLFIIQMKIKHAIYGFGVISFIFSILQFINPIYGFGVGHIVHLSGLIVGYILTLYWKNTNKIQTY
jgi:hypothetical protein